MSNNGKYGFTLAEGATHVAHFDKIRRAAFNLVKGNTHVAHFDKIRRVAFTLAEVLITLGIIGVVAALTIPTLMANHRKQVVVTRMQKFYTTFNQAIMLAENKYGEIEYWDNADLFTPTGSGDWFNKYLAEFFTSKDVELLSSTYYTSYIKLGDGSAFGMRFGNMTTETNFDIYFFPNAYDIDICETNNQPNSIESCVGKKQFTFRFTPEKGLQPYGYWLGLNRAQLIEKCRDSGLYCTAIIMMDGWQISKDYPRRI